MKFFMFHTPKPDQANQPPSPEFFAEMMKFLEEQKKAGVLLDTGGLLPISQGGALISCNNGEFTVLDGPYTESKELMVGYALIQVNSLEEAIKTSRRFYAIVGDGDGEIRQVME